MILICWHITTTIISNIVIFSSAMPVVIIFFKMTEKGQIFMKKHI